MTTYGKVDANQTEIVQALRDAGCSVLVLSQAGRSCPGSPDLAVGRLGKTVFMEVKAPGGKLTPAEVKFKDSWQGNYYIVHNVDEALAAIGLIEDCGN